MKIIFSLVLLFGVLLLILFPTLRQSLPLSIGTYHLLNLIKPPKDFYKPIILEDFDLKQKGLVAEYDFKPKFFDFYALAILLESLKFEAEPFSDFSSKLKFKGKLKVEMFYKNKGTLIFSKEINSSEQVIKLDDGSIQVNLFSFSVPVDDKYFKDLLIRVEVIEPDNNLSLFSKNTKILVGVNGIP